MSFRPPKILAYSGSGGIPFYERLMFYGKRHTFYAEVTGHLEGRVRQHKTKEIKEFTRSIVIN